MRTQKIPAGGGAAVPVVDGPRRDSPNEKHRAGDTSKEKLDVVTPVKYFFFI